MRNPTFSASIIQRGIFLPAQIGAVLAARRKRAAPGRFRPFLDIGIAGRLGVTALFDHPRGVWVGCRCRVQERLRVRMLRVGKQHLRLGLLHQSTSVHHRDAIAEITHDTQVVSDEQQCQLQVLLQLAQQVEYLRLHAHVES